MKIRFLDIAQVELDDAVEYYNYESSGLGEQFLTEILNTLDRIAQFPKAWNISSERTRRCQTRRFPYGVIYQYLGDETLVVAIANLHRKPNYWKDRM